MRTLVGSFSQRFLSSSQISESPPLLRRARTLLTAALLAITLPTTSLFSQENDTRWIPESSNAVAVVRIRKLLDSPLGKAEKWSDQNRSAYASGLLSAPPWATEVIRSTQWSPGASSNASETVSIYKSARDVSIAEIAKHERAKAERLGDKAAVVSTRGVYFIGITPRVIGSVQPADRQVASRWIKEGLAQDEHTISPILQEAITNSPEEALLIAVDLKDILHADGVKQWLSSSDTFREVKNLDELATVVTSVEGFQLGIKATDRLTGRLHLKFAAPISEELGPWVPKVVIQWLNEAGAGVADSERSIKVNTHSVTLESTMDMDTFRRVLSLIRSPHPETGENESASATALASVNYFEQVDEIIKNLRRQTSNTPNYEKTALWHEKFAEQIESLPTTGVDAELSKWGYETSRNLRALSGSLRGTPMEVNSLEKKIRVDVRTTNVATAATPYGYIYRPLVVGTENNIADIRARQAEVIAQDALDRNEAWKVIELQQKEIASQMSEKYKLKFGR